MSIERVARWVAELRDMETFPAHGRLHPQNLRQGVHIAVDALDASSLHEAMSIVGATPDRVGILAPSTVPSSVIEWCALALAGGSEVVVKVSSRAPALVPLLANAAQQVGLPLTCVSSLHGLASCDLIVSMGSDATVTMLTETFPTARHLAFGHRVSAAWIGKAHVDASVVGLAHDLLLHDGRGCMSPLVILTDAPGTTLLDALAPALAHISQTLPSGARTPAEGAARRSLIALAQILGTHREGSDWDILHLPPSQVPQNLPPRTALLVTFDTAHVAAQWLRTQGWDWSTFGATPDWTEALDVPRICLPGQMQRPPLLRHHDGVDHLALLRRSPTL